MKGFIYKITSPSNRVYIGKTKNIGRRIWYYKNGKCKTQTLLFNSILKYGWDSHHFEILDEVELFLIDDREKEFIEKYKSNLLKYPNENGLNLSSGGEGNTGPKSDGFKNKMKEKWVDPVFREKMNKIYNSPEWIEMCRVRNIGKVLSEETKKKMRKPKTEETKVKLRKPKKTRTLEHRKNLSKSLLGKRASEESKRKMSEAKNKKIYQLDLNNNIIKEWYSIKEATKTLNIPNISHVLNGRYKTAGGYKWKYKNEENE